MDTMVMVCGHRTAHDIPPAGRARRPVKSAREALGSCHHPRSVILGSARRTLLVAAAFGVTATRAVVVPGTVTESETRGGGSRSFDSGSLVLPINTVQRQAEAQRAAGSHVLDTQITGTRGWNMTMNDTEAGQFLRENVLFSWKEAISGAPGQKHAVQTFLEDFVLDRFSAVGAIAPQHDEVAPAFNILELSYSDAVPAAREAALFGTSSAEELGSMLDHAASSQSQPLGGETGRRPSGLLSLWRGQWGELPQQSKRKIIVLMQDANPSFLGRRSPSPPENCAEPEHQLEQKPPRAVLSEENEKGKARARILKLQIDNRDIKKSLEKALEGGKVDAKAEAEDGGVPGASPRGALFELVFMNDGLCVCDFAGGIHVTCGGIPIARSKHDDEDATNATKKFFTEVVSLLRPGTGRAVFTSSTKIYGADPDFDQRIAATETREAARRFHAEQVHNVLRELADQGLLEIEIFEQAMRPNTTRNVLAGTVRSSSPAVSPYGSYLGTRPQSPALAGSLVGGRAQPGAASATGTGRGPFASMQSSPTLQPMKEEVPVDLHSSSGGDAEEVRLEDPDGAFELEELGDPQALLVRTRGSAADMVYQSTEDYAEVHRPHPQVAQPPPPFLPSSPEQPLLPAPTPAVPLTPLEALRRGLPFDDFLKSPPRSEYEFDPLGVGGPLFGPQSPKRSSSSWSSACPSAAETPRKTSWPTCTCCGGSCPASYFGTNCPFSSSAPGCTSPSCSAKANFKRIGSESSVASVSTCTGMPRNSSWSSMEDQAQDYTSTENSIIVIRRL